jgi:hypothetical protein
MVDPSYMTAWKVPMSNPWLKKNPFMSMWLSAANRVAGTLRGQATAQATAQARRQAKRHLNAVIEETISLPSAPKAKR